jgi:hypothetical protein
VHQESRRLLWKCKWWCTSDFRSFKRSCTSSYFERCSWSLFSINVKLISDTTDFPLSSSKCPRLSKFLYSLLFNCSKHVLHHWPWKRRPYSLDYRTFLETMIFFTNIVCFTISSERFVRFWPKFGQHINYLKHLYSYDFRLDGPLLNKESSTFPSEASPLVTHHRLSCLQEGLDNKLRVCWRQNKSPGQVISLLEDNFIIKVIWIIVRRIEFK